MNHKLETRERPDCAAVFATAKQRSVFLLTLKNYLRCFGRTQLLLSVKLSTESWIVVVIAFGSHLDLVAGPVLQDLSRPFPDHKTAKSLSNVMQIRQVGKSVALANQL